MAALKQYSWPVLFYFMVYMDNRFQYFTTAKCDVWWAVGTSGGGARPAVFFDSQQRTAVVHLNCCPTAVGQQQVNGVGGVSSLTSITTLWLQ